MQAPLVHETEWLSLLRSAPPWSPPPKPTIVLAPHPDDETLAAGGLIQHQLGSGVPVQVIAVTDGEAAYENSGGLAQIRAGEQRQALEVLGLPASQIVRLALPDSGVSGVENRLAELLAPLLSPGHLIVAPWISDWHPDHEACARAVAAVCRQSGVQVVSWLFWTYHRRTLAHLAGASLVRLELPPEFQAAKRRALKCHASQLRHEADEPILPGMFLEPAWRPFETFVTHA